MRFVVPTLVLLAAAAPAFAGPKRLPARNVACGDVITESVRLANSLFDCPVVGLEVGAAGITIDLGGHIVDGVDASVGIDNGAGHANVTIRNGTVRDFGIGVRVANAAGNTVTGLRVTSITGDAILLAAATGAQVRGNRVHSNTNGIYVESAADNVIAENDVSENGFAGIYLEQSTRNFLLGNFVSGNGTYGFQVYAASGNVFRANVATGNGVTGFLVESGASENVLRANRAVGNREDGFRILGGTGNVLQKSAADENARHGIFSDTSALTLRGNRANRNGFADGVADDAGLGIFVPAGATQSGNKAAGNDDARECESSELSCAVL